MGDPFFAHLKYLEEVAADNGIAHSSWSIYTDNYDRDLLEPHPYVGAQTLIYESSEFFGRPFGIFTAEVKGPRWVDLWIAADDILGRCGDKHHCYIERFNPIGDSKLSMDTGS